MYLFSIINTQNIKKKIIFAGIIVHFFILIKGRNID